MDKEVLVSSGKALIEAMDEEGMPPRLAMWVHNTDLDTWKFWVVPPKGSDDKREFYRRLSAIVSKKRQSLAGIDASDTEYVSEDHPAARGLKTFIRMEGVGAARFSGNTFNGFYLPDGIIMRSAL